METDRTRGDLHILNSALPRQSFDGMFPEVCLKQLQWPRRRSVETVIISLCYPCMCYCGNSYHEENLTHTASTRSTTDTAAVEVSKIKSFYV